ncbi:MAG: U32 family peptidase [Bacteroidales bacterium]|jgi:putative protease|nr:U32 family peptidase [Bacteroidales bacterium]
MRTELLLPAKDLQCGIAAVNHGADAVYIGAPQYSARRAAGNSIADIEYLCKYAHVYNAKVYAAINTVLDDRELEAARRLSFRLYEAGIDALIIQDMGLLTAELPPVPLHASTQTDNRTAEKCLFLQETGFSRAVLARELSVDDIAAIHRACSIELEVFVHGAVCVSYSGQCYISQYGCGRSANRGECAQYCRLPYTLTDGSGKTLLKNRHLLSLKDMNRADSIRELLNAGVTSLKVEGRLKDVDYVKNIATFYRRKLDAIMEEHPDIFRASSGRCTFFFTPNPELTFNRGATDYFLHGRQRNMAGFDAPKSTGQFVGKVSRVGENFIDIDSEHTFNNGDGFIFLNKWGIASGFRINRAEGTRLYPASMPAIAPGMQLWRNHNQAFTRMLQADSAVRKIDVDIELSETEHGFLLTFCDAEQLAVSREFECAKSPALKAACARTLIEKQLGKLGNTPFVARYIRLNLSQVWFIPVSELAMWRRTLVELLLQRREDARIVAAENTCQQLPRINPPHAFKGQHIAATANVHNRQAEAFYRAAGATSVEPSFEHRFTNIPLMTCRWCLRYELEKCPKANAGAELWQEPLSLHYNDKIFRLQFDCQHCEMKVFGKSKL